ncbi:ATP-binding protein [Actinoplanes sp. RD1]|uniref:ATP-binding protein n=1 Tax=Actinoplanes sp. RD1 TaxID=3064538 RepID=UPI00274084A9|nr:ATP-binding protein [Actinoplanes sp. RD1]
MTSGRSSVLRTLGFAALYVVATYAGRKTVMDATNLSLVWPAAGVSAVWFVAQRASRWRWLDAVALAGVTMVVNTATGASWQLAAFFVAANLAQAMMFAWLFGRWLPHLWGGGGLQPLARLQELWRLVAAAFIATACGAVLGPTGVMIVSGFYSWPATAVWMTRNTVSILLIGVAGIRLGHLLHTRTPGSVGSLRARSRAAWAAMPSLRRLEYGALVLASAGAYVLAFGASQGLPLAFPLLVMTVWAGLRLHTGFVIVHDIVFGTVAVLFTLAGHGPFAAIDSHPLRALIAQLFVGMVAVVGLALALGRDERTALVSRLRGSEQAAEGQTRLMRAIVDSLTEGLTVVDGQGRLLLRNPAVRQLLGGVVSSTGQMADPGYYGLFHPDGTPLEGDQMPYRRALAGDPVTAMDILVRNPGVPDGRIVSVSSSAIPGELDGIHYAVTVFHDVTAERRHRDELASFAGVVAHDLLNPLATVEGWTELLAEAFAEDPGHPAAAEAADGVARIRRAAGRMRNLINDLLAYTTARDASITPIPLDLNAVVTDIATARIDQAQSNHTPVPVFDIGELHTVQADPVLVRQLLDNLISNSIKYTAPGVVPSLRIASDTEGDQVRVTITDNGIGIPAGQHTSIFTNFHRAHRTGGYTGTGLGLGICRRIVQRHGGTITAADNPAGQGSQFVFTLPAEGVAVRAHEPAAPDVPPREVKAPPAPIAPTAALPPPAPAPGFEQTARLVLDYLHEHLPLAFWAVTRVENGRQVYLYLDDNGYGLRQGDSHPWEDSFCVHMAAGRAPAVAPDAQGIPVYAAAGVNDLIDIGAYAGAVISEPDGSVFGAICGLDPQAHTGDSRLTGAEPLLALLGRILTAALAADRARQRPDTPPIEHHSDAHAGLPAGRR